MVIIGFTDEQVYLFWLGKYLSQALKWPSFND